MMLERWQAETCLDQDLCVRRMLGRKVGEVVWDYVLRILGHHCRILGGVESHFLFSQQDFLNTYLFKKKYSFLR